MNTKEFLKFLGQKLKLKLMVKLKMMEAQLDMDKNQFHFILTFIINHLNMPLII
jgi:hypothetical protein